VFTRTVKVFTHTVNGILLALCTVTAPTAFAACLALTSHPDGRSLAEVSLSQDPADFTIGYMHSVTRTLVVERYKLAGSEIVETEMRFEQHGPGLPTEADAGGTFTSGNGVFTVTMDRHFPAIVMQVHKDQMPRLSAGTRTLDLAQWGNRALALAGSPEPCAGP